MIPRSLLPAANPRDSFPNSTTSFCVMYCSSVMPPVHVPFCLPCSSLIFPCHSLITPPTQKGLFKKCGSSQPSRSKHNEPTAPPIRASKLNLSRPVLLLSKKGLFVLRQLESCDIPQCAFLVLCPLTEFKPGQRLHPQFYVHRWEFF